MDLGHELPEYSSDTEDGSGDKRSNGRYPWSTYRLHTEGYHLCHRDHHVARVHPNIDPEKGEIAAHDSETITAI